MTDHPDPTALRLEGQRLVEAATKLPWALREPLEERPWMTHCGQPWENAHDHP